jgi:hypothetical protein
MKQKWFDCWVGVIVTASLMWLQVLNNSEKILLNKYDCNYWYGALTSYNRWFVLIASTV